MYISPKNPQPGRPPTLGQIKMSFPLPGKYHFRFKAPLVPGADQQPNAAAVWMDCRHDDQPVGVWKNAIFAKVTRISMEEDEGYHYTPPQPEQAQVQQRRPPQPTPVPRAPPQRVSPNPNTAPLNPQQSLDVNLLGVFDHQTQNAPVLAHSSSGDLLGEQTPPPVPVGGESLLDFGHDHGHQQSSEGYGNDLLGMGGHHHEHTQPQQHTQSNPFPF